MADRSRPHLPLSLTDKDKDIIQGIKDMAKGQMLPEHQVKVYNFIVERLGAYHDLSYRPDDMGGERATTFHEGRRFVAASLVKIEKLPWKILIGDNNDT